MLYIRRRFVMVLILMIILMNILAVNALAVDNFNDVEKAINNQQVDNTKSPNLFLNFVKLVIILALIVGAAWSIIRIFGKKARTRMQGTWIHVVDEVMLGQNRGVVLCEAGERVFALGVTDHNISVLFEVHNSKLLEEISQSNITAVDSEEVLNLNSLKEILTGIIKPRKSISRVPKDFHLLIEQQARRLDNMNYDNVQDSDVNMRRSDRDD